MEFSRDIAGREQDLVDLFETTFAASEGAEEGMLIGGLVRALLSGTPKDDIHVFTARDNGTLIGGAIFSRLTYEDDPRTVFILSPMAVLPEHQGQGVGQALLTYALSKLREGGVDVAITYGDPAFYGRVGFRLLTETAAAPPFALSQPVGWIGQSLTGAALTPLQGKSRCVEALNIPDVW